MAVYLGSNEVCVRGGTKNITGDISLQDKTVTPTKFSQTIIADSNYDGLSSVVINAIPSNYIDTSDATAISGDIAKDKTAYVNGQKITGNYSLTDDSYVWEKYESDPSVIIETSKTDQNICAKKSGSSYSWMAIYYADEIKNTDGELSLVNSTRVQWAASNTNPSSNASVLLGKYILSNESFATSVENYYFIPTSATFTTTSTSSGYLLKVSSATKLEGQTMLNYVTSKNSDTYPTNGEHTDGYWYVYKGLMSDIMSGSGETTTPTLQTKTVTPSESSQSVTPDSGYDGLSKVTVNAISSTYVGSGVTQKSAATITPSTSNQTIASGTYLSGTQTIKGDSNLVAGNIKSGVSIFGVSGSYTASSSGTDTSDATASASDILNGKTAYVKGSKITGTIASQAAQTITPGTSDKTIASGKYLSGTQTIKGDSNLVAGNIKSGVSIFGVTGSYTGSGSSSGGTTMKSGTTTSGTINTGLSSISAIVIYKDTLTATGLIQGVYITDGDTLHYTYCSSYNTYYKTCAASTSTASSVSGGTFTLGTSGTSGLSSSTTYNWIAFGET